MIRIHGLRHVYPGGRKTSPRIAIHALDLAVAKGEFCVLSGPNGSGKSTLFRILCGLMRPSAGTIHIDGADLFAEPAKVRRALGVVFQSPALDKHLTVAENLKLHANLYGITGKLFAERREAALAWSNLKDRLADKVETLSGGLARQVELAKSLLPRPSILLLDEPTTGLDPTSRRSFLEALTRLQRELSMTVLMTSHVFAEAEGVDRVAIMKDGRLIAHDSPKALTSALGHEVIVITALDPAKLCAALVDELGLEAKLYGDEVRLVECNGAAALPVIEKILGRFRLEITSLAIKQPTLDDVFVHHTGKSEETSCSE
jgi:ABC-2 type transport system ATP-binding protein